MNRASTAPSIPILIPILILFLFLTLAAAPPAPAFHEAGSAVCEGCHILHASEDGSGVPAFGAMLLRAENATDVCLSCHAGAYGEVLGSDPRMPPDERGAGNFTFLLEDDIHDGPGAAQGPIPGHHAGHSVVSIAWNLPADPDRELSPGGTYPSADLGCTSCHDPHGNQEYRMLWGDGSTTATGFRFTFPAPSGDGIPLDGQESITSHTAYTDGWSRWCANCHGRYHDEGSPSFEHPIDRALGMTERTTYNTYDGQANPTGGTFETAYLPEVPLENDTYTPTSTTGAAPSSRISCMTCHRAHATSAPAALRWDPNVLTLYGDGDPSGSYPIPDPYGHVNQRSLCVKCHISDASHGMRQVCLDCHRSSGD